MSAMKGWAPNSIDSASGSRRAMKAAGPAHQPARKPGAACDFDSDDATTVRLARSGSSKGEANVLGSVPGLRVHVPQAGMFVMLSVDGLGLDGEAFADALLTQAQVAVMPGIAFGAAAAGMVRMSLTVPDDALAEGCARLAALAQRLAR